MKHSTIIKKLIKRTRPLYSEPTKEYNGFFYIGFGHRIKIGEVSKYQGASITKEESSKLLDKTLKSLDSQLSKHLPDSLELTQSQYDAIISLCYDIGVKAFITSELYEVINVKPEERDLSKIATMFRRYSLYKKQTKYSLLKRRKAEIRLFSLASTDIKD